MIKEFRDFLVRGNLVELAVALARRARAREAWTPRPLVAERRPRARRTREAALAGLYSRLLAVLAREPGSPSPLVARALRAPVSAVAGVRMPIHLDPHYRRRVISARMVALGCARVSSASSWSSFWAGTSRWTSNPARSSSCCSSSPRKPERMRPRRALRHEAEQRTGRHPPKSDVRSLEGPAPAQAPGDLGISSH